MQSREKDPVNFLSYKYVDWSLMSLFDDNNFLPSSKYPPLFMMHFSIAQNIPDIISSFLIYLIHFGKK